MALETRGTISGRDVEQRVKPGDSADWASWLGRRLVWLSAASPWLGWLGAAERTLHMILTPHQYSMRWTDTPVSALG